MAQAKPVGFWFDPSCPYTWLTSRWLIEVATVRAIDIRWHIMSLSVLNEGREVDPEGDTEGYLWYPVRVCAAVERHHGEAGLAAFYTALGDRLHKDQPQWDDKVFPDALTEAGFSPGMAGEATSGEYDAAIRASHARAVALVGDHVGTPIIATTGGDGQAVAFFGPVISRIPRGEAAGSLWDLVVGLAAIDDFHELKTTAPRPPDYAG